MRRTIEEAGAWQLRTRMPAWKAATTRRKQEIEHGTNHENTPTAATRTAADGHKWPPGEVLTLAEAAAYLRLPENAVQAAVQEQNLPGRFINGEWRFLKTGIQDWLRSGPKPTSNKEGWMALAGAWKDDPNLDEL